MLNTCFRCRGVVRLVAHPWRAALGSNTWRFLSILMFDWTDVRVRNLLETIDVGFVRAGLCYVCYRRCLRGSPSSTGLGHAQHTAMHRPM